MRGEHARQIYENVVRPLPSSERLQLLVLTAQGLSFEGSDDSEESPLNITELHGLGKEIWKDVDPDQYVRELRQEWERPQD